MNLNKKGGEKLLSIWWFVVLAIAGGAIVVGVIMFYSADVDAREIESSILYERLLGCVNNNGFADYRLFTGIKEIYKECDLKREVFEKGSYFFFRLSLFDEKGNAVGNNVSGGDVSYEKSCEIARTVEAKGFPRCVNGTESILYVKDGQVYQGKIVIYTGSNQIGIKSGGLKIAA